MRNSSHFYDALRQLIPELPDPKIVRELTLHIDVEAIPVVTVVYYPDLPESGRTVTWTFKAVEE